MTDTTVEKDQSFRSKLIRMKACGWDDDTESVGWVGNRSLHDAWASCHRGDWMLWLAAQAHVDRKLLVLAACDCARLSLRHVPDGEVRPRVAIETAEAWCRGEASLEEVLAASFAAAYADDSAAAAYAAAADAYDSAAFAYAAAADAASAAAAAAHSADDADDAAHSAASADANAFADAFAWVEAANATLAKCADLVRARIPIELVEAGLEDI
jgi:hypothetical protein